MRKYISYNEKGNLINIWDKIRLDETIMKILYCFPT